MNYEAKDMGVIAGEDVSFTLQKALSELENTCLRGKLKCCKRMSKNL